MPIKWALRRCALCVSHRLPCIVFHMDFHKIRHAGSSFILALSALCLLTFPCLPASAQADKPADKTDKSAADKGAERAGLPPLPADAHVQQSIQLDGKTLRYTVTVGTLPVRDKEGKEAGQVVFTAYTVEGSDRPITFAFTGGPGASSVYLNFAAIGPRNLQVGNAGA